MTGNISISGPAIGLAFLMIGEVEVTARRLEGDRTAPILTSELVNDVSYVLAAKQGNPSPNETEIRILKDALVKLQVQEMLEGAQAAKPVDLGLHLVKEAVDTVTPDAVKTQNIFNDKPQGINLGAPKS